MTTLPRPSMKLTRRVFRLPLHARDGTRGGTGGDAHPSGDGLAADQRPRAVAATASCSSSWPGGTSRSATSRPSSGPPGPCSSRLMMMVVFTIFFGRLAGAAVRRRAVPAVRPSRPAALDVLRHRRRQRPATAWSARSG